MITKGRNSYLVEPIEYWNPVVTIGSFSCIADKVVFCGDMNHTWVGHKELITTWPVQLSWGLKYCEGTVSRGPIIIGSDVWIGREAWIMDGVTIGDGAIIGARAMVAKNVPPYAVVVGNPGVVKHYRFTPEQIAVLLKVKWWEWTDDVIKARIAEMRDIKLFVQKYA